VQSLQVGQRTIEKRRHYGPFVSTGWRTARQGGHDQNLHRTAEVLSIAERNENIAVVGADGDMASIAWPARGQQKDTSITACEIAVLKTAILDESRTMSSRANTLTFRY